MKRVYLDRDDIRIIGINFADSVDHFRIIFEQITDDRSMKTGEVEEAVRNLKKCRDMIDEVINIIESKSG